MGILLFVTPLLANPLQNLIYIKYENKTLIMCNNKIPRLPYSLIGLGPYVEVSGMSQIS